MINRAFDQITKTDIDSLVIEGVREDRTLDYKESLPDNTREKRIEFLADVSAFANAGGGDLVYGIEEERENGKPTGKPNAVKGLALINPADAEVLRLDNMLRNGVKPRPVVRISVVPEFPPSTPVILVRVSRGWSGPHVVDSDGHFRFYTRNSAGKHPMDVSEIRTAFALSEALGDRVRKFRDERLGHILADETPLPLQRSARVAIHLFPASAADVGTGIDVRQLDSFRRFLAPPHFDSVHDERYNVDGYLTSQRGSHNGHTAAYLQIFRSGAIEAVDAAVFNQDKNFHPAWIMRDITPAVERYLQLLKAVDVQPPIFCMITLIGVRGFFMRFESPVGFNTLEYPIDRDVLILPDVVFDDYQRQISQVLRPVFDTLWQTVGQRECPYYDSNGNFDDSKLR